MKTILSTWTDSYATSHSSVARIIAQEKHIEVIVEGDGFANSSDFRTLVVVGLILQERPDSITKTHISKVAEKVAADFNKIPKKGRGKAASVIYMPSLPPDSPVQLKKALDGGLLHEIFHSLYTARGNPDQERLYDVLSSAWEPDKLKRVGYLVKPMWNVFEDVMIERLGCQNFPGAADLLQAVHYYLWDQESKNPPEVDTQAYIIAHAIGYLRDYCKSQVYLKNIPLYDSKITDHFGRDILDEALHTRTSYDTLRLALKVCYLLHDLLEDPPAMSSMSGESEESSQDPTPPSDSNNGGTDQGDNEGDVSASEHSRDEDDQEDAGEDSDSDEEDSSEHDDGEEDGEAKEPSVNAQNLSDAISQAVRKHMEHVFQTGREEWRIVRPTSVKDRFSAPTTNAVSARDLQKTLRNIQSELARIRPPLVAMLDNKDHLVRKPYQEAGRALSARSLTTLLGQRPRPFEQRYQEHAEKSCVLILLDLSGSMQNVMDIARDATMSVSMVLKSCNVPFAVLGFTSMNSAPSIPAGYTHGDYLIITVAKDFHEPLSLTVQERIAALRPQGATPLPDAFDLGVKILQSRQEKRKHLFVISDGAPFYASSVNVNTLHLLKKRMEAASRHTLPFLLNVDEKGNSPHTKGLPNTQTIRSFKEMPQALLRHLRGSNTPNT